MSCKRFIASLLLLCIASFASAAEPKKVLLLSQKRDHPPASHEYHSGVHVLAKCLQGVPGLQVTVVNADEPCPEAPKLIDAADAIVLYLGEGGRWMQLDKKRLEAINKLAARGGGIVGLHWGIGAKDDKYVPRHVELMGGMHGGSDRKYVVKELDVRTVSRDHPINAGVDLKRLDDEYYYRLKFAKQGQVTPLLGNHHRRQRRDDRLGLRAARRRPLLRLRRHALSQELATRRLPPPRRARRPLDAQAARPQSGPAGRGHGRRPEDPRRPVGRRNDRD